MPDLLIYDDGANAIVKPKTDIGRLWLDENIEADTPWAMGGAIIPTHLLAALMAGARDDGMQVEE